MSTAVEVLPQLAACHDNIILKPITREKTEGGLILPENQQRRQREGIVVAVGPGKLADTYPPKRLPLCVEVGDRVIFREYADGKISVDGEDFAVVSDCEIICVLPSEA